MFKGTMTKWPVQKLTQGTTQNSYNIMTQQTFKQTIFLCFSDFNFFIFFFIDNFLNEFSKKCLESHTLYLLKEIFLVTGVINTLNY